MATALENPKERRRKWSEEEDKRLVQLVQQFGLNHWRFISAYIPDRDGKQCRERYFNHLAPDVRRGPLSLAEWRLLFDAHAQHGNQWTRIARYLPGRTANDLKNVWNTRMRQEAGQELRKQSGPGSWDTARDPSPTLKRRRLNVGSEEADAPRKSPNVRSRQGDSDAEMDVEEGDKVKVAADDNYHRPSPSTSDGASPSSHRSSSGAYDSKSSDMSVDHSAGTPTLGTPPLLAFSPECTESSPSVSSTTPQSQIQSATPPPSAPGEVASPAIAMTDALDDELNEALIFDSTQDLELVPRTPWQPF